MVCVFKTSSFNHISLHFAMAISMSSSSGAIGPVDCFFASSARWILCRLSHRGSIAYKAYYCSSHLLLFLKYEAL